MTSQRHCQCGMTLEREKRWSTRCIPKWKILQILLILSGIWLIWMLLELVERQFQRSIRLLIHMMFLMKQKIMLLIELGEMPMMSLKAYMIENLLRVIWVVSQSNILQLFRPFKPQLSRIVLILMLMVILCSLRYKHLNKWRLVQKRKSVNLNHLC